MSRIKLECADQPLLIEQRLDFSCWVPEGFGTGDCLIVADKLLHFIDFKYGQGVLVDAEENPQMMLYALGALRLFDFLYDITEVSMSIYQPRRENVSTWTISVDELNAWAENTLKPKAETEVGGLGKQVGLQRPIRACVSVPLAGDACGRVFGCGLLALHDGVGRYSGPPSLAGGGGRCPRLGEAEAVPVPDVGKYLGRVPSRPGDQRPGQE